MKPLPDNKSEKEPTMIITGEKVMLKTLKESDMESFILISKPKDNISSNQKEPIPNEIVKLL